MTDTTLEVVFDEGLSSTVHSFVLKSVMGDVSRAVPAATINANCCSYGAGCHSWQWAPWRKTAIAMKGMLYAGRVIARVAETMSDEPALVQKAREELDRRLVAKATDASSP